MYARSIHTVMTLTVLGLLLCIPMAVRADLLTHGFSVTYDVNYDGFYLGNTVRTLKPLPDGNWQYKSITKAKGLAGMIFHDTVRETSTFKQSGNTIVPLSYIYDQSGGKDITHYQIDFLWDKHLIHNSDNNKDYKLEPNAQDLQTFQLQIMRDMQTHQNTITLFIADQKDVSTYVVTQNGNTKIDTPYKSLETIELTSNKLKKNDQYQIWCAPSLEYLPVRMRKIDRKGHTTEFVIKDFKRQ